MGGNINDGMTTTCLILGPSAVDKIDNSLNSSVVRISDNKSDLASYLPTNSSQQIVEIVVSATDCSTTLIPWLFPVLFQT